MEQSNPGRGRTVRAADPAVHRIEFDIDWSPGHAAAFLIEAGEPVLVDAGAPGEAAERTLREGLAALGHGIGDVEHVLLTHPHSDHIGQTPALRSAGARVYAPASARARLRRDEDDVAAAVRRTARRAGLDAAAVDRAVDRATDSLARNRRLLAPDGIDVAVEYGGALSVGGLTVDAIHAPGHQADQACFAADLGGERALFAGDALLEPFRAAALHVGLDRGAEESIAAFYRTCDRLAGRSVDAVYPGHGPPFDDYEGAVAALRERLDATVAAVADALPPEGATAAEATRRRGKPVDPPVALLDTVGALGSLERRGRAVADRGADGAVRYRPAESDPGPHGD